jgi:hypothetical protein
LDSVEAALALLIEDSVEMRLIQAVRSVPLESRMSLVELAEQMAALRVGRKAKTAEVAA